MSEQRNVDKEKRHEYYLAHRESIIKRAIEWRKSNRERYNSYRNGVYFERCKAGVCPKCGKRAPLEDFMVCDVCLAKERAYQRRMTEKRKEQSNGAQ